MTRVSSVAISLVVLALAIQLVPYGREHGNPDVTREPGWDRPRTRELFSRACNDCHSNRTVWPWYSFVAPASWLVQHDVEEGRSRLNVSEWGEHESHAEEAPDLVRSAEMPPWFYLPAHPEARLSADEREALATGLEATIGAARSGHPHDHHDD